MIQRPRGIEFRETLSGHFQLGESDPRVGAERGAQSGSVLSIHNVITIADLDAFRRDPEHAAELDTILDFSPIGHGIPTLPGRFHLMVSSPAERARLLIYRFGFEYQGQRHHFEGTKYLPEGLPLPAIWRHMTTLHATLHRGENARAPIVGAGVLSIDIRESLAMIRSMRAPGIHVGPARPRAMMSFGWFVMTRMWKVVRGAGA